METKKQSNRENMIIMQLISAELGCAKEKLIEDPTYLFRIQFHYKNFEKEEDSGIKIKSQKKKLKEGVMDFHKEVIFFRKTDRYKGLIEMRMMLGSETKGKQFKPCVIYLHNLKFNEEDTVTWQFPANSRLTLKYRYTNGMEGIQEFCKKNKIGTTEIKVPVIRKDNLNLTVDLGVVDDINTENDKNDNKVTKVKTFSSSSKLTEMTEMNKVKDDNVIIPGFKSKLSMFEQFSRQNTISSNNPLQTAKTLTSSISNCEIPNISTIVIKPTIKSNDQSPFKLQDEAFNSFCEGFFITSFSPVNGKILENSQTYQGMCGHLPCSLLPAMEPEILYRYPLTDTKDLELNSLVASLCFPVGIKVCYNQDRRATYKNYYTPITNQQGERYYMMTYHFYNKIDSSEYIKKYVTNPLKIYMNKFGDNFFETESEKKKLESDLEVCGDFAFRNDVYVPFCIALISKYPYIKEMDKALGRIFAIITDQSNNPSEINDLITYFIRSIPVPPYKSMVSFSIPQTEDVIDLYHPINSQLANKNLCLLLDFLSVDNIIYIYSLLFYESKMLFIDREYNRLCQIVEGVISLLYPIEWINTYIPIMSEQMTKYLQAFLPFVNGINENLYEMNAKNAINEAEDGIFLIFLTKDQITYSKGEEKLKELDISPLPKDIIDKLSKELKMVKNVIEKMDKGEKEKNIQWINMFIRNCFIEAFCMMFYDFMDYLNNIDDDYTVFNTEMLLNNRNKKDDKFYKDITDTQIFQNFIQNISKDQSNFYCFLSVLSSIKEQKTKNSFKKKKIYSIEDIKKSVEESAYYSCIKANDIVNTIYSINPIVIKENNLKSFSSNSNPSFVQEIDSSLYKEEKDIPKYYIPSMSFSKKSSKRTSVSIITKVDIYEKKIQTKASKENNDIKRRNMKKESELSKKDIEEIEENIKDIGTFIFKSDYKSIDIDKIIKAIYIPAGRNMFCKVIYQNNNSSIKKIQADCFEVLNKLARNSLISLCNVNETDNTVENAMMITKASFYYCKGKDENCLLIDELVNKLKDYFLWVKDSFWNMWLRYIYKESDIKNANNEETIKNILLTNFIEKMLRMKINKEFIMSYCVSVLTKKNIEPEHIEDIKNEIKEKVAKYKYN